MNAGRRVRLTFEATVEPAGHCPDILRVLQDSGTVTYVDTSHSAGVTLEDVAPAHTWTDGDVIVVQVLSGWWSAVRTHDGEWWTTAQAERPERERKPWGDDARVTGLVESGSALVLRYQAGEQ